MKTKISLLICSCLMQFSCSERIYPKGLNSHEFTPMTTPYYSGEMVTENYLQFSGGRGVQSRLLDENVHFQAGWHTSTAFKNINYSIGPNLYFGRYEVGPASFPHVPTALKLNYYGIGFRHQIGVRESYSSNLNWEIIGVQTHFLLEGGPYFKFKSAQQNRSGLSVPEVPFKLLNTAYTHLQMKPSENDFHFGLYIGASYSLFGPVEFRNNFDIYLQGKNFGIHLNPVWVIFRDGNRRQIPDFSWTASVSWKLKSGAKQREKERMNKEQKRN